MGLGPRPASHPAETGADSDRPAVRAHPRARPCDGRPRPRRGPTHARRALDSAAHRKHPGRCRPTQRPHGVETRPPRSVVPRTPREPRRATRLAEQPLQLEAMLGTASMVDEVGIPRLPKSKVPHQISPKGRSTTRPLKATDYAPWRKLVIDAAAPPPAHSALEFLVLRVGGEC